MVDECIGFTHDLIPSGDNASYTFLLTRSETHSSNSNRALKESIKNTLIISNQSDLHLVHKQQEKKRKHSGWLPSGRLQQDHPKPVDYLQDDDVTQTIAIASCPHDLKCLLPNLIECAMKGFGKPSVQPIRLLADLNFPVYLKPTCHLLSVTREVIGKFIPTNDLECLESMLRAREHVMYWKPRKVKVILLAESHAHTP